MYVHTWVIGYVLICSFICMCIYMYIIQVYYYKCSLICMCIYVHNTGLLLQILNVLLKLFNKTQWYLYSVCILHVVYLQ